MSIGYSLSKLHTSNQTSLNWSSMELLADAACNVAVKKCKVSEFGEEDRISRIPDPILACILSLLPTNDAVKTMLLKPFGKLWTTMSNLDFYVCLFEDLPSTPSMHRWFSFVDHVLLHHEAPTVTKFRLKFGRTIYSSGLKLGQIVEKIDSWIDFAVRKKVEILEVDIGRRCRYEPVFSYQLPSLVLRSDILTELHLASCSWITDVVHMKSLKTLSLRTISLYDTVMEEMLSGCPSLETLIIIDCLGLQLLKLPRVKDLKITMDESEMSLLDIIAPNLSSICVSGAIGYVDLKGPSSLSVVTIDFFRGGKSFTSRHRNIWILLSDIKHVEYVRLCHWCVLVLAIREWNDWLSLTRKSVIIETRPTRWHFLGIKSLLRNSPKLEVLTVCIEPDTFLLAWDDMMHQAIGSVVIICSQMRGTVNFNEICSHLKIVNIRGYVLNSFAIQLVKFLLRSSHCLEQVVISSEACGNKLSEYRIENSWGLYEELLHCARASKQVIVRLNGLIC